MISENITIDEQTTNGKMLDIDCKLEKLVEEETELLRHTEIKDKKNNIELLKSRLAKPRIKDNKNTILMDEK